MESVIRYSSTSTNRDAVRAMHRMAAHMADRVERLGLDAMPNVTVSATGSWLESDDHANKED